MGNESDILHDTLRSLAPFNPKSVFLYGSRGRKDAKPDSDYEIGVIFQDDLYVQRSEIHASITNSNVKAYPFKWTELRSGRFDTPFIKSIYLREIIEGGRTIAGEHLIEHIPPPSITTLDLVQRIRFDIGYALAALLSFRTGDMSTSMEEFGKSCLFGLRCLEILDLKTFPFGYQQIHELSRKVVDDPEYLSVIDAAFSLRGKKESVSIDLVFKNISFLNRLVEAKIASRFSAKGIEDLA
jgi:predicted nucleotidyltransferase